MDVLDSQNTLDVPVEVPLRRSFTRRFTQKVRSKSKLKKCVSTPPKTSRSLENLVKYAPPLSAPAPPSVEIVGQVKAKPEERAKLMPDWELTGTKNGWVCPSDRQLTLRAQLKAGWSVRSQQKTTKKSDKPTLTEAEQEQIKKVLERSKQTENVEQVRIGRLIERLDAMRDRAIGNGVSQCLLCGAEFGLLGPRSYAAMCNDCRKYVCQRNCGVETYDPHGTPIFLCKLCSETREVLKKSNAWFTGAIPKYVLPPAGSESSNPISPTSARRKSENPWIRRPPAKQDYSAMRAEDIEDEPSSDEENNWASKNDSRINRGPYDKNRESSRRRLPVTPVTDRSRRSAAPTPRWAQENRLGRDSYSSSDDERDELGHTLPSTSSALASLTKPRWATQTPQFSVPPLSSQNIQRISCTRSHALSDSASEGEAESRSPTPPSSPRGLQTPNSTNEEQMQTHIPNDAFDSKSVDSGVVQSDHSQTTINSSRPNSLQAVHSSPMKVENIVHSPQQTQQTVPFRRSSKSSTLSGGNDDVTSVVSVQSGSTSTVGGYGSPVKLTNSLQLESSHSLKKDSSFDCPTPNLLSSPDDDAIDSGAAGAVHSPGTISHDHHRHRLPKFLSSALSFRFSLPFYEFRKTPSVRSSSLSLDNEFGNLGTLEFTLLFDETTQTLTVHLIGAKNLKPMDSNGFSDPYVVLHLLPGGLKSTKHRTKTIEKTLNPDWNEQITLFGVSEEDRLKKILRLTVMDEDRIGSDFQGETRVPLRKLTNKKPRHFNVYLEKQKPVEKIEEKDLERGKIMLSLLFSSQNQALVVGIVRCAELIGMDPNGYSDPYVKVSLKPETSKKSHAKTRVKKKNLNPEFHEEFTLPVSSSDLPNKTLVITVFDKDVGKQDDYIGGLEFNSKSKGERLRHWTSCLQNPGSKIQRWHKLQADPIDSAK